MKVINMGLGVVTKKLELKVYAIPKPTLKNKEASLDEEIKSQIKNIN